MIKEKFDEDVSAVTISRWWKKAGFKPEESVSESKNLFLPESIQQ